MSTPAGIPRATVGRPPLAGAVPYGLFSAATIGEGVDPHELNGVEYETVCSTDVREWPPRCGTRTGSDDITGYREKHAVETSSATRADPFAVYAAETCVLGNTQPDDLEQFRQRFQLGEPAAVEHVFHTGKLGNRPALAPDAVVLGNQTNPLPLARAIGLLEHWLACISGGTGVIHAPRWTAESLATSQLLGTRGPQAATKLGTTVAFATGYPGSAPAAAQAEDTDKKTWLYATRPVTIRRSTVTEPTEWGAGNVDLPHNVGFRMVERSYVIDVPCGQVAAVRTDLPLLDPNPPDPPPTEGQHTTSHIKEVRA